MAQYLFPGAAAKGYEPLPREDPVNEYPVNEKALPFDWQADVADARRRIRRRRILFSAATAAVLLTPLAFLGIMRHHRHCGQYSGHGFGPYTPGNELGNLADVEPDRLTQWLAQLGGYRGVEDLEDDGLSSYLGKCKKAKIPWQGNGKYYVDPADLSQIELLVKAHHIETKLKVTHDGDTDDLSMGEEEGEGEGEGYDYDYDDDEMDNMDDDDDDDGGDDKEGKIYIKAKVFFSHEKLQDSVKLTEKRDENGHYTWRIEEAHGSPHDGPPHGPPHDGPPHDGPHGPPHGPPPHGPPHDGPHGPPHGPPHDGPHGPPHGPPPHGPPHKHGKRPPCGRAHIHIHLPKGFTDLDALNLGLASGKIQTKGLGHVQFGNFTAGLYRGLVHAGNINAVQMIAAGAIHGDVVLHHAQAHAAFLGTATGRVHLSDIEARKLVRANALSGEIIIGRTKTPTVVAKTVSGRVVTNEHVETDHLIAKSLSGEVKLRGTVAHGVRARTVSGAIHANIDYQPKDGDGDGDDDDDGGDDDDDDDDGDDGGDDLVQDKRYDATLRSTGKRAAISLGAVSGSINLELKDYTGRFSARSMTGQVNVHGDEVHLDQDTDHRKTGYVHDDGNGVDAPIVSASAVTGSISLSFD